MTGAILRAERLSHRYRQGGTVLSGIDFSADAGEVVALTGPSGRGKSTLLFILGLLLVPTKGSVRVFGQDTRRLTDRGRSRLRAETFGYLFQDAALDGSRSVLDNVTEPALYSTGCSRRSLNARAEELLEEFDVRQRKHARPGRLSGGQAQRIALCRALVLHPRIIVADEPTGNLDSATSDLVISGLARRAKEGSTVIIATHDERVVGAADREVRL